MSHVRVTINDTVECDQDVDHWQQRPPEFVKDQLRFDAKPQPWLKTIMVTMADAVQAGVSVDINASHRSNRWEMKVEYQ